MDGRLCFKGQTGHWPSLGSLGWLAAATLLANGPMVPSSNHTQPPDIKMLSRTGQALGLHWAPSGEPHVVNGLVLAHRQKMHKFKGEGPTSPE